uniref:Uncharacterized protein n=2 Tax=unclassified Caudoviricetes TaxID=2788787 RepID=A0A8S5SKA3_9CAUD|nr:MAG TPA: hypothetical protein [Siphoviridae sp. ctkTc5]DAF53614.1 MAG TPA: hypothetical protein [Siphoviridae sp. ctfM019]DAT94953.1 MAG TPA: hypothetical protein [Caudoviricetes sp.]DAX57400.1 MAG TPA: hypothetical protein [Caudoviricetes sp.]
MGEAPTYRIQSLFEWLFYFSKQINSRRFRLG